MADDEDAAAYRRELGEVLRHHGFGWVVDQAEIQIIEGKPSSKRISERETFALRSDPMFTIRRPRRRQASLITSEAYSEEERLEILMNAIDAALVQRAELEIAVLDMLDKIHPVSSVGFRPDVPSEVAEGSPLGRSHRVDHGRRASAEEIRSRAKLALNDIRRRERAGS